MQTNCPHCGHLLEYSGDPPRFCSHCGQALSSRPVDETLSAPTIGAPAAKGGAPERLGPYRIERELGRGGMGAVFEAEHEESGRRVAIKLLPDNVYRAEASVERFLREGQNAAAISHPRSTFVYAAGEIDGQFYISMELMPGGTLRDVVDQRGQLPIAEAVDNVLDVVDGLAAAHALGVIHRDIKPSNCFVDQDERVKVGDYGLSKSLVSDSSLTRTGAFLGTPQFAAPEQIKGGDVDARTDIYAIGATLYFLLGGRAPFEGDAARVIAAIASEEAEPIGRLRSDLPAPLREFIHSMLAKDPARRPQTLDELRQSLTPFSSRGVSIADLGRRLGAFFVDIVASSFATGLIALLLVLIAVVVYGAALTELNNDRLTSIVAGAFITVATTAYFTISEGLWGRTLGKRLLGLRVVTTNGARLGLVRSLARSVIVPGLSLVCVYVVTTAVALEHLDRAAAGDRYEAVRLLVSQQVIPIVGLGIGLLCMATARRSSGFRGAHELLSGSRVIRSVTARTTSELVPLFAAGLARSETDETPELYGSYRVTGTVSQIEGGAIHTARDESLERPVWIVARRNGAAPNDNRMALARPNRLHWIAGGLSGELRWDAYEAVRGAPLTAMLETTPTMTWQQAIPWLGDLADELQAAMEDGTLPPQLTLGQLWVERTGRLKLLDYVPEGADDAAFAEQSDDVVRVTSLIDSVLCRFVGDCPPASAIDLAEEFRRRGASLEAIQWFGQRVRTLETQPLRISWDDRLGVLAVSFNVESSAYYMIVSALAIAMCLVDAPILATAALLTVFAMTLPCGLGWFFSGGPVFAFTGIQLRSVRDGSVAPRWRSAWRNFVAWAPATVGYALLGLVSAHQTLNTLGAAIPPEQLTMAVYGVCTLFGLLGLLVQFSGALLSIARPERALQDVLSGVYLSPTPPP